MQNNTRISWSYEKSKNFKIKKICSMRNSEQIESKFRILCVMNVSKWIKIIVYLLTLTLMMEVNQHIKIYESNFCPRDQIKSSYTIFILSLHFIKNISYIFALWIVVNSNHCLMKHIMNFIFKQIGMNVLNVQDYGVSQIQILRKCSVFINAGIVNHTIL